MKPIEFKEQNFVFEKPKEMTDEECSPLPCYREAGQIISKWELTEEENEHIAEHGYIFINVFGGIQPPIMPSAQKELPLIFKDVLDG